MRRPDWIVPSDRVDLSVLDADLSLCWNHKRTRYEVWNQTGMVEAVTGPHGQFRQPGTWLLSHLRRRDPRHNIDIDAIVQEVSAELNASEEQHLAAKDAPIEAEIAGLSEHYAPIFRREMYDDPIIAKPFTTGRS